MNMNFFHKLKITKEKTFVSALNNTMPRRDSELFGYARSQSFRNFATEYFNKIIHHNIYSKPNLFETFIKNKIIKCLIVYRYNVGALTIDMNP
jgi:hypothetical protein